MAVLYVPHFMQFFNDDGNPLSGGKLYTYAAGTVTPKATYTTAAGTTPNANPITLDSAGRAVAFLSGSYKFRLQDSAGNLIKETDNVTAFSDQTGGVDDIIANFTEDVVTAADSIIFADVSDGNATKRDTVQGILDLVPTPTVPTITGWVAYTPTFAGLGTVSGVSVFSRRVGDSLECRGIVTAGTVTASVASMTLGYNGTNSNVTLNTSKLPSGNSLVGYSLQVTTSSSDRTVIAVTSATGEVRFGIRASSGLTPANGNVLLNTGEQFAFFFTVPINGWT